MPLAAIVTLIWVTLIVAALAFYLIRVILLLRDTSFNLGTIIAGVYSIEMQTLPLNDMLGRVNSELGSLRADLDALVAQATGVAAEPPSTARTRDYPGARRPTR